MTFLRTVFFALLFVLPVSAQDSDPVVEKILQEGKTNSKVMEHLDHLVNQIGPRLTSSDNLTKACEWTKEQFASWGLEARLEEWGTFPVGFNRGPWSGKMVAPEERMLTFCTPSWTPGTPGEVTGPAMLAPESEQAIDKAKLKGAWVFQSKRPSTELRKALQTAYEEAGIAGLVRRVRGKLIVTDGNSRISWDKLPKTVLIDLLEADFDPIVALLKEGKEVRLSFDIRSEFKKGPIKLYNVIADLKGSEKPGEYVVVGGHIDSWDGARGCVDNGTGCATTLEAARLLVAAGAKPKRTIRFMLWGGEEQGLLGSASYVKKHKDEMKNYSACLVHDGGTNALRGIGGTEAMMPHLEKVFAPVMTLDEKMPFKVRKVKALSAFGASDHASFTAAGVPGFFWDQKGKANYEYAHHTQHDNFDQAIPEYQKHSSLVVAIGAYGIANLETLLPREGVGRSAPAADERPRRLLGVNLGEEEGGVVIVSVSEGSAAEKAGLHEGDVIKVFSGKPVSDSDELRELIQTAPKKTSIVVLREGKEMELPVQFDGDPAAPAPPQVQGRRLGVDLGETEDGELLIEGVAEESAAARAGLKEGDVILKLDGKAVSDVDELRDAMQKAKPETTILIRRDGKELELPVKWDGGRKP